MSRAYTQPTVDRFRCVKKIEANRRTTRHPRTSDVTLEPGSMCLFWPIGLVPRIYLFTA